MTEHIRTYASAEEMFADMRRAEDGANAAMTAHQRRHLDAAAENPTYAFRVWEGLVIVGETSTPRARAERERELGAEDFDYDLERFTEVHGRGYLTGRWYSVVEPDGELGDTHVSQVVWIDPLVFNTLREFGWDMERLQRDAPFIKAVAFLGNLRSNITDTYPDAEWLP